MASRFYQTFGPDAEVLGQAMVAFVASINFNNFQHILQQHGLSDIDSSKWYPQQVWLDVFNDMVAERNASNNFVSIGMKVVETMVTPPGVEAIPFLEMMKGFGENSYRANNRGADIGYITTEVVSDNHVIMHDATPYPDDFVYGAYYAMARRFLPKGTTFIVKFDEDIPRRNYGGSETLVHITWG
jgi:hypothetical protein